MPRKTLFVVALAAALSSIAFAQGYGPGAGGGGCGATNGTACGGYGPGAGRGMRGGSPLMTPEEMAAHRNAMHSLKSVDECRAYVEQHRAEMAARAQQQGIAPGPGPRADMCDRMAARGFFQ